MKNPTHAKFLSWIEHRTRSNYFRVSLIAIILIGLPFSFFAAAGLIGSSALTPQRIVDRQEGKIPYPGFRRAHAKGVCVSGEFISSGSLDRISVASLFAPGRSPFVGRFSIGGNNPTAPDLKSPVRSFAMSIRQKDGQQWRTAMNTPPVFAVATPQAFYEQLLASTPEPKTGRPNPDAMKAFFAKHPESAAFRSWQARYKPTASFATERYHSINAFYLVDHKGSRQAVRWTIVPEARALPSPKVGEADALQEELIERLADAPITFNLIFTLAADGDPVNDPTRPWPDSRRTINAGTIRVLSAHAQKGGQCDGLNFNPLILPSGITPTDDPILRARSAAYAESQRRRARERLLEYGK